jgi:putative FmdB family regulatory protein
MPTYQYQCEACDHSFEILQSMMDKKLKKCPDCGKSKLNRLIGSGSGIIFKGNGFYETDYKKKESPKDGSSAKTAKSDNAAKETGACCGGSSCQHMAGQAA